MKRPLFIVFNLGSGHGDASAARAAIEQAWTGAGRELHLMDVPGPRRLAEVARQAVQRAQQAGGVVVAAGGDVTINAVAQATLGSCCVFGVLPQGTFNYFSRTHGIPANTAQAMQVLLQHDALPVQVGLVNQKAFLVNVSLGLSHTKALDLPTRCTIRRSQAQGLERRRQRLLAGPVALPGVGRLE